MDIRITNDEARLFTEQLSEEGGCDYTLLSNAIIKSRIRQLLYKYKINNTTDDDDAIRYTDLPW